MAAVAHGWHKPGGGGPPVSVAKEFNQADKGTGIMSKSTSNSVAHYARGGAVIGKVSEFMKTPNEFSERSHDSGATDEVFGKGSSPGDEDQARGPANPKPKNKQVPRP